MCFLFNHLIISCFQQIARGSELKLSPFTWSYIWTSHLICKWITILHWIPLYMIYVSCLYTSAMPYIPLRLTVMLIQFPRVAHTRQHLFRHDCSISVAHQFWLLLQNGIYLRNASATQLSWQFLQSFHRFQLFICFDILQRAQPFNKSRFCISTATMCSCCT